MEAALKVPETMSTAEFLVWNAPGTGKRWQLVEGVPQAMAPGSPTHGSMQAEIGRLLGNHFLEQDSPCTVIMEPGIVPRVRAAQNLRIPDLGVTCATFLEEAAILQEPVLLIEILSPSNKAETWSNVWTYTTIPSVREILIVRSDEVGADLLRRQPDGSWPAEPLRFDPDDLLMLDTVGFACPLRAIYRTTRLAAQ